MSSSSLRRSAGSSNSLSNFQPVLSPAQLKLREAEREVARRAAAESFSACVELDQRLLASALDEVDENVAQYLRWRKILLLSLQHEERLQGHGGYGDRKYKTYSKWREILIKKRQFIRDLPAEEREQLKRSQSTLTKTPSVVLAPVTKSQTPSDAQKAAMPGGGKVNDAYAFTGMHHIFGEQTQAVTRVKFANDDKDLLAFGGKDSTISICEAFFNPRVTVVLKGHTKPITDFDWSMTNEMIISTSVDQTIRVWNTKTGASLRKIPEEGAVPNCCLFYPLNNNMFFVGNSKGVVKSINLSTGKPLQRVEMSNCSIQTIEIDPLGSLLFAGDSRGTLYIYSYTMATQQLRPQVKMELSPGKAITSLRYKGWYNTKDQSPELIANCQDGTLKLFSILKVAQSVGVGGSGSGSGSGGGGGNSMVNIKYKKFFPCQNKGLPIRSCFCPLISIRDGACIVTGSSDFSIYIYDVKREGEGEGACVNQFMGHSGAVLDVSWNYDESLLASCDSAGMVILWKRILINRENPVENYRN